MKKKQISFWEYMLDCSTVKENTINCIDNRSYINSFDFVTITNNHKHFPNFSISRQLNSNMSKTTKFSST